MKAVVAAFNQEKALVGAFSVITNLRMEFGWNFLKHYARLKREEEEEGDVVDGVWSWVRRFRSVRSIHFSDDIMLKLAGPDSVQYLR